MSREFRSSESWPLLFALQEAAVAEKPLIVISCFNPEGYELTRRNVHFYKEGLIEVAKNLLAKNIGFELHHGNPEKVITQIIARYDAHSLILDFDPLKESKELKIHLVESCKKPIHEVDGHNIVPAWLASQKKEYAAYTIRPKINRLLADYLTDYPAVTSAPFLWLPTEPADTKIDFSAIKPQLYNSQAPIVDWLKPGQNGARQTAEDFLTARLKLYHEQRNDPLDRVQSELSPSFHFGHISAQQVALMTQKTSAPQKAKEDFLEEMIIRKELSDNFCLYEKNYDNFFGLHEWAQKTLNEHRNDTREYLYSFDDFDQGKTHQPLWNSCQSELRTTGKLHGYLRMYWAKKILEWSESPEEAQNIAIILNDRYALDGRDPNGYTGIAWSIGGIHDRAWQERPVFGKIRYMNANGCKRKFDVSSYIHKHKPQQLELFSSI